jgi:hypothetical protein
MACGGEGFEGSGWPVRTCEDFERLLLDHLKDGPDAGPPRPSLVDLVLAVELGEGLLAGKLCCTTMSGRLRHVACAGAGGDPIEALLAAFARKKKRLPT